MDKEHWLAVNKTITGWCRMIKEFEQKQTELFFPQFTWLIIFFHCLHKGDGGSHQNMIALSAYFFWKEHYYSCYSFICILLLVVLLGSYSPQEITDAFSNTHFKFLLIFAGSAKLLGSKLGFSDERLHF